MTENENQVETTEAQAPESLTINDLLLLKNMIAIVSPRGAFKAEEMEAVGRVYNKLTAFIDAATKSAQTSDDQEQVNE